MSVSTSNVFLGVLISTILYRLYVRLRRISVAHIPGPESPSFIFGNLVQLVEGQAAETEFKWQAKYGDIVRFKGLFGQDRLLISDVKALQYIYQTSGYHFPKQPERKEISRLTSGRSITWADGETHKRQRKIMLPGFSGPEARYYQPVFSGCAARMVKSWKDIISSSGEDSSVINISHWSSRCTLDAIGEVAFDYRFQTLEHGKNELGKAYGTLLLGLFTAPSKMQVFLQNIIAYVPRRAREWIGDHFPTKRLEHTRYTAKLSAQVARGLLSQKSEGHGHGNDIMSRLVKANSTEDVKFRLSDEEMMGFMRVVILAGHDTTSNTLSWMLLELSRHPDVQTKLREEIRQVQRTLQSCDQTAYTQADLDAMPYLNAVLKETLRYHPAAVNTYRYAGRDDVLPLSKPITTTTGEIITELPIPKGLRIMTSINGYNRNKEIFGHDADKFNPERWLDSGIKKSTSLGVIGNLLTFSGGIRSCIGWKFAYAELQAFLFEIIGQMEFSPTPETKRIRREAVLIMVPTLEGEVEKGAQMPLRVRVAV